MRVALITVSLLLVGSNLVWAYLAVEVIIGNGYREVSCEEYQKDAGELLAAIERNETQKEILAWLNDNLIERNAFQKGEEFIVSLNSFDFEFNPDGSISEINKR